LKQDRGIRSLAVMHKFSHALLTLLMLVTLASQSPVLADGWAIGGPVHLATITGNGICRIGLPVAMFEQKYLVQHFGGESSCLLVTGPDKDGYFEVTDNQECSDSRLPSWTGVSVGDKFYLQMPTQDGTGTLLIAEVIGFFYRPGGVVSSELRFGVTATIPESPRPGIGALVAAHQSQWAGQTTEAVDTSIPQQVTAAARVRADAWHQQTIGDDPQAYGTVIADDTIGALIAVQPFIGGFRSEPNRLLYLVNFAIPAKSKTHSKTMVLDAGGHEVERPRFTQDCRQPVMGIKGITDANGDGRHELLLRVGEAYGCSGWAVYYYAQNWGDLRSPSTWLSACD
jgi:hypothetical protein